MWEYKRMDIKFNHFYELIQEMNKEGIENWEVSYYHELTPEKFGEQFVAKILFKRIKKPA